MKKVLIGLLCIFISVAMAAQIDGIRRNSTGTVTFAERKSLDQTIDQVNINTAAIAVGSVLSSPTFTGTVTIPSPFTLGATSVTSTGTKLNYLTGATGTTGTATTNLVYSASPTFTGTVTLPVVSVGSVATFDSTLNLGSFGDATQTLLATETTNTSALLGVYPMVNFAAASGKVYAGSYSRMLFLTANQTNGVNGFGMESQFRLKNINLAGEYHGGLWAYAEQSGTTTLSGGGYFCGLFAMIESEAGLTAGATAENICGVVIDGAINVSATLDAGTNYSGIFIEARGKEWKTGIKITDVDSIDIAFQNGATIDNEQTDTLRITETITEVVGTLYVTGDISSGGTTSDFAITDEQPSLADYWDKTLELNKLPAFEEIDRQNLVRYINGLEEAAERNLRYIVAQDARIAALEEALNE